MQNAKIILFLMKNTLRTSKKVFVLATRFAEDEARERGLLKMGIFLKIDAFYGKGADFARNALLEPRGEKV